MGQHVCCVSLPTMMENGILMLECIKYITSLISYKYEVKRNPFNESVVHAMIFNWLCEQYRWRSSYQEGRVCIPLTDLTPLHFWSCPKPGPGFPTSYAVIFLLWSVSSAKTRSDLFYFVDIGGIDNHHYLNFLFN